MDKHYGLSAQFVRWILISTVASVVFFCVLYFGCHALLSYYFEVSNFQERRTESHANEFQAYVVKNRLNVTDTAQITAWAKKAPLILLEIYHQNTLVYNSAYPRNESIWENKIESPYYEWENYRTITFNDGNSDIVLYCDDTYLYYNYVTIIEIILSFLFFLLIYLKGSGGLITYVCQLSSEIQVLEGGSLDCPVTIKGNNELTTLAKGLDSMRCAFKQQREQEAKSFNMNQSLIVDMSHDLRTPLTTLLIYTEILRYKKYKSEEQLNDYLEKIDAKAHQIKQLSDNIFEYSLLNRGKTEKLEAPKLFKTIFYQQLAEAVNCLKQAEYQVILELDWEAAYLSVNHQYIERIFGNLVTNIEKYADPSAPVMIETVKSSSHLGFSFTNTISPKADSNAGTHIGLNNVDSMMKKMNGNCRVERSDSGFCITLLFPKC